MNILCVVVVVVVVVVVAKRIKNSELKKNVIYSDNNIVKSDHADAKSF